MAEFERPLHEMREYIRNFSLDNLPHGNQGYQRVLLQLVGLIGLGKSALINSCKCVLDDSQFHMYATATDEGCSAVTVTRNAYELTPTITIVDNRPLLRTTGEETAEMYAQLGNFRPLNEYVNKMWTFKDFMSTLEDADLDPNYADLTVPVFVHSGKGFFYHQEVQIFLRNCKLMTGILPIVVITNKATSCTSDVENKFRAMGVDHVFLVENITAENGERSRRKDTDILTFLYNALQDAAYYLSSQRDRRAERIERKKFLLNYFHEVCIEKVTLRK